MISKIFLKFPKCEPHDSCKMDSFLKKVCNLDKQNFLRQLITKTELKDNM